jgi:transcriptional regulator with XRE-family HTH domain
MEELEYTKILGTRLRNFRKRAGLSQMEMELEIGASSGYLSRVENGEVNPTKESLEKMSRVLRLNHKEYDYLAGQLFYVASDEEVRNAIKESDKYFSTDGVLCYLLDDRNRLIALSKTFRKIYKIDDKKLKSLQLKPFLFLLLDQDINIFKSIAPKHRKEIITTLMHRWMSEVAFMKDDLDTQNTLELIMKHEITKDIFTKLSSNFIPTVIQPQDVRQVIFNFHGLEFDMTYSSYQLLNNKRFEVVEYTLTNQLLKVISKIL